MDKILSKVKKKTKKKTNTNWLNYKTCQYVEPLILLPFHDGGERELLFLERGERDLLLTAAGGGEVLLGGRGERDLFLEGECFPFLGDGDLCDVSGDEDDFLRRWDDRGLRWGED